MTTPRHVVRPPAARLLLGAAVLLLAAATSAAAQAPERPLPGPVDAAVRPLLDSARAVGLPLAPLLNKAHEGVTKGADAARIAGAVRRLAFELAAVRGAIGTDGEAELVAGAAAVRAGVPLDSLRALRAARRGALGVPLVLVADLVSRGVPADTAVGALIALRRSGIGDDALTVVASRVEHDIALGTPPLAALGAHTSASAIAAAVQRPTPRRGEAARIP